MGYNKNLTQNQNVFQPTARNLLGVNSPNIKFSNEFIPYKPIEVRTQPYNSKLLVIPTTSRSPYNHISCKIKSVL